MSNDTPDENRFAPPAPSPIAALGTRLGAAIVDVILVVKV